MKSPYSRNSRTIDLPRQMTTQRKESSMKRRQSVDRYGKEVSVERESLYKKSAQKKKKTIDICHSAFRKRVVKQEPIAQDSDGTYIYMDL